ncbi:hypothetical protein GGR26_001346 [Lewinella marina]|uniref:Uncharacterized protein n=1 Tax=Neolewinella marina TaxID=438751 RepID=A0A2G0CFG3_9BACT|nr:hypothetical protein [Neolewinella marina]NJB85601.1 hypothetical protein [Neolewinella marina]PHK98714.1 hypothetical protein CGL56_09615 [Neolewinella marina]
MLREFNNLTDEEQQLMFDAIPLIVILVGAADNDLDEVELTEAQRLADIRTYNTRGRLSAYYEKIDKGLSARIQQLYNGMQNGIEQREKFIVKELSKLNDILPKLREPYGYLYYHNFRTFARHIAEAHGGFLRFITVGPKEAKVMELPMIKPIPKPPEDEYPNLLG